MKIFHFLTIFTGLIESLFFSGIIFGWHSLQYILQTENYFSYLCQVERGNRTLKENYLNETSTQCSQMDSSFNLSFTIATALLSILCFPVGLMLDHYGTWIMRCITCFFFTLGSALITLSSPTTAWLLYPANVFIGVSGLALLMINVQIANLLETWRGLIVTLVNGMFDSGAIVFFIFKVLYDSGYSITSIFHVYTWCTLFIWLRTFILMPRHLIPYPLPVLYRYGWQEWKCFSNKLVVEVELDERKNDLMETSSNKDDEGDDDDTTTITFKDCLQRKSFWTNVFHLSILAFKIDFYLGTFITWVGYYENVNEVSHLTNALGIMLLGGCLVSSLNGILIDGIKNFFISRGIDAKASLLRSTCFTTFMTTMLSALTSIMVIIRSYYPSFIFEVFARGFTFAGCAAFIACTFPSRHFGKLYGLTVSIVGVVNLFQNAVFQIAIAVDPNFYKINIGLLVITFITLIHPFMLYRLGFKAPARL